MPAWRLWQGRDPAISFFRPGLVRQHFAAVAIPRPELVRGSHLAHLGSGYLHSAQAA